MRTRVAWVVAAFSMTLVAQMQPKLSLRSFTHIADAAPAAALSNRLRQWLTADLRRRAHACAAQVQTTVIEIPPANKSGHVYVVSHRAPCTCGATGNCTVTLLEETPGGIRLIARVDAWGYSFAQRTNAPYPDIFFSAHMSSRETAVSGYGYAGGRWANLYCGSITFDDAGHEADDIHECPR